MMQMAEIQARMKNGVLHVQGGGPAINRDYGLSVNVEVPEELGDWMSAQEHPFESLAGSERAYAPAVAKLAGEEIEILIEGKPLNDERGARLRSSDLHLLKSFLQQYES